MQCKHSIIALAHNCHIKQSYIRPKHLSNHISVIFLPTSVRFTLTPLKMRTPSKKYAQKTTRNEWMPERKSVTNKLQQLVAKISSPSEHIKKGGTKTQACFCYFWTHGRAGHSDHTSVTCKWSKNGHSKTGNIADVKRGSNDNFTLWSGIDKKRVVLT